MDRVEKQVNALVRQGALVRGKGAQSGWLASKEALQLEGAILAGVDQGRGAAAPILERKDAVTRVQAVSAINHGITLNPGQEEAASLVLSSRDRIVAIQGVAGAGKSSVMKPVAHPKARDARRQEGTEAYIQPLAPQARWERRPFLIVRTQVAQAL